MNDINDIHDLAAPYVLDALDEGERTVFEAHLSRCPECRTSVAELAAGAGALGAAAAASPPPRLRGAVLSAIEGVAQEQTEPRSRVVPLRRRTLPRWTGLVAVAAVAVLIVGVALGLRGSADPLDTVLEAADATTVTVPPTGDYPAGATSVVFSAGEAGAVFLADGLPALPADSTYQAWVIEPDATVPRPAGLFLPESDGSVRVLLEQAVAPGAIVAISIEPAAGSTAPTTDPILAAVLPG